MDIAALAARLALGHPDEGAYDADAGVAAGQLNTVNRTRSRTSLSGNKLFTSTDGDEFAALTDAKRQRWVSWCNTSRDPTNASNISFVNYIFGLGSDTIGNLAAIRTEAVSHANEIEPYLGFISPGHVENARM